MDWDLALPQGLGSEFLSFSEVLIDDLSQIEVPQVRELEIRIL